MNRCSCQRSPLLRKAELDHLRPDRSSVLLMGGQRFGAAKVLELHGKVMEKFCTLSLHLKTSSAGLVYIRHLDEVKETFRLHR